MLATVLAAYGLSENQCSVAPFGSGLINRTWLVTCTEKRYILQRINTQVFEHPQLIAENTDRIGCFLQETAPAYFFVRPLKTTAHQSLFHHPTAGFFRLSPFVEHSHTIDVVSSTTQAYEAAKQFGRFTKMLQNFDVETLQTPLPRFHDLAWRYQQFLQSVAAATPVRKRAAQEVMAFLTSQHTLVETYEKLIHQASFKKRVTHHDTKISNVLFDRHDNGMCVIDLDTVMPGYFISDVGDMMRTYLSPVSEEEKDTSKIAVRDDYFLAIAAGYLSEMQIALSDVEKQQFVFAGKMMIYMQALRFVTDYLNNDRYYGQYYEGHNLVRAQNQATLLQALMTKGEALQQKMAAL